MKILQKINRNLIKKKKKKQRQQQLAMIGYYALDKCKTYRYLVTPINERLKIMQSLNLTINLEI